LLLLLHRCHLLLLLHLLLLWGVLQGRVWLRHPD